MKKIAAILLIFILLFNIVGYRWVFTYLDDKATQRLEEKIEAGQYNESQLVEIKIPLQLPYYTDSKYESFYGETEFNGEHFRYVKRKVSGNTLYLLCLPHTEKDNIAGVRTDFIKAINDVQDKNSPQKNGQASIVNLMLSEFLKEEKLNDFALLLITSKNLNSSHSNLTSQFEPMTASQPPEMIL